MRPHRIGPQRPLSSPLLAVAAAVVAAGPASADTPVTWLGFGSWSNHLSWGLGPGCFPTNGLCMVEDWCVSVPPAGLLLTVDTSPVVTDLFISGGRILPGGSGTTILAERYLWISGGQIIGPMTLRSADKLLLDSGTHLNGVTVEVEGICTVSGTNITTFGYSPMKTVLHNEVGATLHLEDEVRILAHGPNNKIQNDGLLRKSGGGLADLDIPLESIGMVDIEEGTLCFGSPTTIEGSVTGLFPSTLEMRSETVFAPGSSLLSDGIVRSLTGTHELAGIFDVRGTLWITGGLVNATNTAQAEIFRLDASSATTNFQGTIEVGRSFAWLGGILGSGSTAVDGECFITSPSAHGMDGHSLKIRPGTKVFHEASISGTGQASVEIEAGAEWQLMGGRFNAPPGPTSGASIGNRGTVVLDTPGSTVIEWAVFNRGLVLLKQGTLVSDLYGQTRGETRLDGGAILSPSAFQPLSIFGGLLSGSGSVGGKVDIDHQGVLAPGVGTAAGNFVINYGVELGPGGTYECELGGVAPGKSDFFDCTPYPAQLDGTLRLSLLPGFTPSVGDSFEILRASNLVGRFAQVALPPSPPGTQWAIVYDADRVRIELRQ